MRTASSRTAASPQGAPAIVVVNSSKERRTITVPLKGFLPDGVPLTGGTTQNGEVTMTIDGLAGNVVFTDSGFDLTGPDAPTGLTATANGVAVDLSWSAVSGAAGYNVYRSPLSGGGYTKVNDAPVTATNLHDAGADLRSGTRYYYIVKALDSAGNESVASNEVSVVPSYPIASVVARPAADARLHDQRRRTHRPRLRPGQDRRRHLAGR